VAGVAKNGVLASCILASALAFIDSSVINVGLPAIDRSFAGAPDALPWVVNAYLLPLSAFLLLGGASGDRFGRRRVLVFGVVGFAIASLVCMGASALWILILGRAMQGIAAACVMPNSLAILSATYEGEARGRAIGIWASMGAVMSAIGPVLGGWLIDEVGWRAIFFINVPLAVMACAMALYFVRDKPREHEAPPLDLLGGLLVSAGLGALTWALTRATGPVGLTASAGVALVAGLLLVLLFLWVEHQKRLNAMLPLALFASRSFVGLTILTLLLYGALGGFFILLPDFLIQSKGYSAAAAGAALLPFTFVLAALSPLMGVAVGRVGARTLLVGGPLIVSVGLVMMCLVDEESSYWFALFPAIIVISVGMAGAVAPLTTAVLASVDDHHAGVASGSNSAVARTGGLIATALLGGVLSERGADLVRGFHRAAVVGAVASLVAALCTLMLLERDRPGR
jgi:EmrB/QacA subfamily drug resistance transporter